MERYFVLANPIGNIGTCNYIEDANALALPYSQQHPHDLVSVYQEGQPFALRIYINGQRYDHIRSGSR